MTEPITIDLKGAISQKMNSKFRSLVSDKTPLQVIVGGANSSKTYSTAQKIIYKTITEKYSRCLAVRKVKKDVKHSVYDFCRAIISDWHLEGLFDYNKTESNIICKINGNDILGVGLDDVNKLKSIFNPTMFWAEEADQMTEDDIEQLNLRLRGPIGCNLQGILTMNPISELHWIKKKYFDNESPRVLTHRSTYKDNEHLSQDVIDRMEAITDPYYKQVYVDGEWGVFGGLVFHNFIIEDFDYTEDDFENVTTGMDFGYTHASSIERIGFRDGEMYSFDELYGKEWINSRFIEAADDQWEDAHDWMIIADSAEPDRIAEWYNFGYRRIEGATKGKNSKRYGVDFLSSRPWHIHKTKCMNLVREVQAFQRRKDSDGNYTEDFVETNDDCIAACRYATEWLWDMPGNIGEYNLGSLGL